jgi:trimeric autotransporter adhesin
MKKIIRLLLTFLCLAAIESKTQAVSPAPDGGYPGGNTAEGTNALFSLTSGTNNNALGFQALNHDTTGSNNTACGADALSKNTVGNNNTAVGFGALFNDTTGGFNTATGELALSSNITGAGNTATGFNALLANTGSFNTATGDLALSSNTTGTFNTATGDQALDANITGSNNTANGEQALTNNTTGGNNTAVGFRALQNSTGNNNIAIGSGAGSNLNTGDNNIYLTALGTNESNTIRIGRAGAQTRVFMQGIHGVSVAGSVVQVNSNGQLGVASSSARFKDDIKPMGDASEAILALKPVTFRYKQEIDPEHMRQFGLVAEEVEKANPDLVVRDKEGKPFTVRYDQVNAMLLNEFLKEHKTVQEQGAIIKQQRKDFEATIARQQQQIDALTAGLQKISAQLEVSKATSQTALNNQ